MFCISFLLKKKYGVSAKIIRQERRMSVCVTEREKESVCDRERERECVCDRERVCV